jgi:hypothetical protein
METPCQTWSSLLAALSRIAITDHARHRMLERRAKFLDVRRALMSATSAKTQDRSGWRVEGGLDRDGDELTVIVDIEAEVIVITLF